MPYCRTLFLALVLATTSYKAYSAEPTPNPSEADIERYLEDITLQKPAASNDLTQIGAWEHKHFPNKTPATFTLKDSTIEIRSDAQFSVLRQKLNVPAESFAKIAFEWHTENDIPKAHTGKADYDDAPIRLILVFDGNRAHFSLKDKMLSELSELLNGEPLAYASLSYTWADAQHKKGEIIDNPRTTRIKNWILEAGPENTQKWLSYERDVHADFQRAFGEAPGRLEQIIIMSDTDNTRSQAQSAIRNIRLLSAKGKEVLRLQ